MQTVMTNSGVELRIENNIIYTTDSKAFWRSGNMLVGNGTVISYQCRSMDEAVDMVAALYNGKKAEAALDAERDVLLQAARHNASRYSEAEDATKKFVIK